ncbi:MAG TPA: dienelactone hydrolase family protein [Terracidiphilus sp.]|jgi:carboxymethylenebutenolidase
MAKRSEHISLRASDGQELGAYVAWPDGEPVAGLVVIQEIFGVNAHIRRVTDSYARDGFLAIAPALFDRIEPGVELQYDGDDAARARSFIPRMDMEKAMLDVQAAVQYAAKSTGKKVGVIGYCWGGTLAWLAASRLPVSAAVGYYGGRIGSYIHETPKSPVMLHFGTQDKHIPRSEVDQVKTAHPDTEIYWYDADHGFNCDARASFNPEAARVARERSLGFLSAHLQHR